MQIVIDIPDKEYEIIKKSNAPMTWVEHLIKNGTPLPNGITNGDVIKAMFNIPDSETDEGLSTVYVYTKTKVLEGGSQDYLREQITFNKDWWNAPYKAESVMK